VIVVFVALAVASAGTVVAYMFWSQTWTTKIKEPIEVKVVDNNLSLTYPGGTDNIVIKLNNKNPDSGYGLFVNVEADNLDMSYGISGSNRRYYRAFESKKDKDFNGDGDLDDFRVNIGGETLTVVFKATVDYDTAPSSVSLSANIHRGEPKKKIQIEYVGNS